MQQVFARILRANPQLRATTRLVLTRNPEPNAHAVGRSTVLLNLGLLPRLENESQLAYVLCHELAHGASYHLETGLRDRLTIIHSKELRREFRRIVNSEYNISSQLKALAGLFAEQQLPPPPLRAAGRLAGLRAAGPHRLRGPAGLPHPATA